MIDTQMIKQGEPARLFPVVSDTSREKRLTSVLLAAMKAIPALAEELLKGISPPFRKTTNTSCFTEVVFRKGETGRDRPDGLIIVENRSTRWTAIVEAKVGKSDLDPVQVEKYLHLARQNSVDAVITISNQFVSRSDHSPVQIVSNDVGLFHLSWSQIQTTCALLGMGDTIDDATQAYVLSELDLLLSEPKAGVERFTNMGLGWKSVSQAVTDQAVIHANCPDVLDAVRSWHQESRDLGLQLSRHLGHLVVEKIDRKYLSDPALRTSEDATLFAEGAYLSSVFDVPDAVSPMSIRADALRKSVTVGMKLRAPEDKKSVSARANWLLRMIDCDDPRVVVRAYWPGRAPYTQKSLQEMREDPDIIGTGKKMLPTSFEIFLIEDMGRRFSGQQTFIQDLERVSQEFYDLVGQNLIAWQPEPPKPVQKEVRTDRKTAMQMMFLWLGGLEGILTNPSVEPVVVMNALNRLRSRIETFTGTRHPEEIMPIFSKDFCTLTARRQLSEILIEITSWSDNATITEEDVESHFIGFSYAVLREGQLTDQEKEDLILRCKNDIIRSSGRVTAALSAIDVGGHIEGLR